MLRVRWTAPAAQDLGLIASFRSRFSPLREGAAFLGAAAFGADVGEWRFSPLREGAAFLGSADQTEFYERFQVSVPFAKGRHFWGRMEQPRAGLP